MTTTYRGWEMRRKGRGFEARKDSITMDAYTTPMLMDRIDKAENRRGSAERIDEIKQEGLLEMSQHVKELV